MECMILVKGDRLEIIKRGWRLFQEFLFSPSWVLGLPLDGSRSSYTPTDLLENPNSLVKLISEVMLQYYHRYLLFGSTLKYLKYAYSFYLAVISRQAQGRPRFSPGWISRDFRCSDQKSASFNFGNLLQHSAC